MSKATSLGPRSLVSGLCAATCAVSLMVGCQQPAGQPAPTAPLGSPAAGPQQGAVVTMLEGQVTFHGQPVANAPLGLVDARSGQQGQVIAVGAGHVIAVGAGHLIAVGAGHAQAPAQAGNVIAVGAGHAQNPVQGGQVIAVGAGHVIAVGAGHFKTDAQGRFSVPVAGLASGEAARLVVQAGSGAALTSTVAGTPAGVIAVGAGHVIAVGAGHAQSPIGTAGVIAVGAGHYRASQARYGLAQAAPGERRWLKRPGAPAGANYHLAQAQPAAGTVAVDVTETTTVLSHLASGALRLTGVLKPEAAAPIIARLAERVDAQAPKVAAYFKANPASANAIAEATKTTDGLVASLPAIEGVVASTVSKTEALAINKEAVTAIATEARKPGSLAPAPQPPTQPGQPAPPPPESVPLVGTGLTASATTTESGGTLSVTGANGQSTTLDGSAPTTDTAFSAPTSSSGTSSTSTATPPPPQITIHAVAEDGTPVPPGTQVYVRLSASPYTLLASHSFVAADNGNWTFTGLQEGVALDVYLGKQGTSYGIASSVTLAPNTPISLNAGDPTAASSLERATIMGHHPTLDSSGFLSESGGVWTANFSVDEGLDATNQTRLRQAFRIYSDPGMPNLDETGTTSLLADSTYPNHLKDGTTFMSDASLPVAITWNSANQFSLSLPVPLRATTTQSSYRVALVGSGTPIVDQDATPLPLGGVQAGAGAGTFTFGGYTTADRFIAKPFFTWSELSPLAAADNAAERWRKVHSTMGTLYMPADTTAPTFTSATHAVSASTSVFTLNFSEPMVAWGRTSPTDTDIALNPDNVSFKFYTSAPGTVAPWITGSETPLNSGGLAGASVSVPYKPGSGWVSGHKPGDPKGVRFTAPSGDTVPIFPSPGGFTHVAIEVRSTVADNAGNLVTGSRVYVLPL